MLVLKRELCVVVVSDLCMSMYTVTDTDSCIIDVSYHTQLHHITQQQRYPPSTSSLVSCLCFSSFSPSSPPINQDTLASPQSSSPAPPLQQQWDGFSHTTQIATELFLSFVLLFFKNFIHIYHLICFYVLYLYSFSHPATIFNKLELSWVEASLFRWPAWPDHRNKFLQDN